MNGRNPGNRNDLCQKLNTEKSTPKMLLKISISPIGYKAMIGVSLVNLVRTFGTRRRLSTD